MVIASFADPETERVFKRVFNGQRSRRFPPELHRVAERKLKMLHAAANLQDLRSPPGNRLEALQGNRAGQHSIRINDQFRVCFRWDDRNAHDVEVVDYH